jgi:Zn-dependent peptidase ImmA (M78 family)
MEWQAGYICGALLMPISLLRYTVGAFQQEHELFGPVAIGSAHAVALIELVRTTFRVSAEAARVRLLKLEYLASEARGPSLFACG